jgi:hypothetical protein
MSDPSKTRDWGLSHHRGMAVEHAVDLSAASRFMTTHARLLERRRFAVRFEDGDPDLALAAIEAYRNPDGGYGTLEPDLRAVESQPVGAMHAFEVFEDVAPVTTPRAAELCDWLTAASLPDGGLPFALPIGDDTATAPFWAGADPAVSSLHITTAVAAVAQRVARHDPAVAGHPWLGAVTGYCLRTMAAQGGPSETLELMYGLRFLDALVGRTGAGDVGGADANATEVLAGWAGGLPSDGILHVEGGLEDEVIRPLEFSPGPATPSRAYLSTDVVDADLDRLAAGQRDDGGWDIDFRPYSPAAALEWRGYATVEAVGVLRAHGRV